ncbi:MAG: hypothetical protein H0U18_17280 [Pyrinomonadaceae bacterium]|nr:hypothetical protein [Pyrinomonadaceae bacterium]
MPAPAHDHFDRYFAEKIWATIPEFYREDDGLADPPGVLRGFVEVLAQQAATLRRSNDRLWDDEFIDLCAEWAVPYIGELVATRMVSALNLRGRRVDVAKTIYYRRRAGTPRILEELIADITGWEGKLVEEFRRLGRMRHGLDPFPQPLAGLLTGTPPGGWANLGSAHGAELSDSPFDEFHHTPDVRRPRGRDGRYGIAKLGFHLYRLASTRLDDVTPVPGPFANTFTFDPSGRDIPLFMRRHRTDDRERFDWEEWISAKEGGVPAPMRCRVLNHAELVITEQVLAGLLVSLPPATANAILGLLRRFKNERIPTEARLFHISEVLTGPQQTALRNPVVWNPLLVAALIAECGKRELLPIGVFPGDLAPTSTSEETSDASVVVKTFRNDLGPPRFVPVARELIVGGDLENGTASIAGVAKDWVIDPRRGRLLWVGAGAAPQPLVSHHYGFSAEIGAGGYDRSESLSAAITHPISDGLAIQTGSPAGLNFLPPGGVLPHVAEVGDSENYTLIDNRDQITRLELRAANRKRPYLRLEDDWLLDTSANLESELTLDGLWIGATDPFEIQLLGDYERVTLRHMTLDPGGVDAAGNPIRAVPLIIVGNVENLIIENSILGPIRVDGGGELTNLEIRDSIIDGQESAAPAISVPAGRVTMRRVTVFGEVKIEWLDASETLITEFTQVTNTQGGCFRFSTVLVRLDPANPLSPHSRVPHPYESYFVKDFNATFTSRIFGQPGYAQLAESAPEFLRRGAENMSEIGAFSSLLNPIKFDSLRAKVEEFAPFGLLPVYVFET